MDASSIEAEITYSTTGATYDPVLATISFNISGIIIDNNSGSTQHLFKKNATFTFFFHDQAGNTGATTAEVTRIKGTEWNYGGTGEIQTFRAPHDGEYLLEARGARGGNGADGLANRSGGIGGYGGYARGVVNLQSGDTLFFIVGTQGQDAPERTSAGNCPGGAGGFGAGGGADGARCSDKAGGG
jgi:hypothetical protein